ncbi:MAG: hypothetical protein AABZ74_11940 [Cyanobacteriota bacterium]
MKENIKIIILISFCCNFTFSQTFRRSFDRQDNGSSSSYGQGYSFESNVINVLHNKESLFLQGYIDMFKATKDKRYLDKFIIHAKRVQERRDDNIQLV